MNLRPLPLRLLALLFAFSLAATSHSAELTVTNNANSGPGSLRQAIADATSGDSIIFSPILSGQTITLASGQILINKNLSLNGSSLADGITLSGNGASRIFQITAGTAVTLSHLGLVNGSSTSGGAIFNQGNLQISFSTLSGNTANNGGAIYSDGQNGGNASLTLNHCTLSGNNAQGGGALFANGRTGGNSIVTLSNCTVSANTGSVLAGGIRIDGGNAGHAELSMLNTIFAGNTSSNSPDIAAASAEVHLQEMNLVSSTQGFTVTSSGNPLIVAAPGLAPLGDYGGPTPTMPPLSGSPAIDPPGGTISSTSTTDQRGLPRINGSILDIGAVEGQFSQTVTLSSDAGAGSLRDAVERSDAGATITFAAGLSGQTIALTGGQILINKDLTIDASGLAAGITIAGNGTSRILHVDGSAAYPTVVLKGLTITGGKALLGPGGGIYAHNADLYLEQCLLTGNIGGRGGAISVEGLDINNRSGLSLRNTLVHANRAENQFPSGGGIYLSYSSAVIENTTITDNNGAYTDAAGTVDPARNNQVDTAGGIRVYRSALTLENSVVAGNGPSYAGAYGDDVLARPVEDDASLNLDSVNFIGESDGFTAISGSPPLSGNPQLAPLGDYGGPTRSRPPLPGSPLIDPAGGASSAPFSTDQRGFPRVVNDIVDIGAVEWNAGSAAAFATGPGDESTGVSPRPEITWSSPVGDIADSYRVYLNDVLVGTVTGGTSFTPEDLLDYETLHHLRIDAVFGATVITGQEVSFTTRGPYLVNVTTAENDGVDVGGISLREAIGEAESGETIRFDPSVFNGEPEDVIVDGRFRIRKDLTIDAADIPGGVTMNANSYNATLFIAGDTDPRSAANVSLSLNSLKMISGGYVDYVAIAISPGSTGELNDSVIFGYKGQFGGGIDNAGDLTIRRSTISNCGFFHNSAILPGGGAIHNSGTLVLEDSTLSHNELDVNSGNKFGGAIYNSGTATISSCTISGNRTFSTKGTAIYTASGGSLTLHQSTVTENWNRWANILPAIAFEGLSSHVDSVIRNCIVTYNGWNPNNIEGFPNFPNGPQIIDSVYEGGVELLPLGDYGGPTQTQPPLPGSICIDRLATDPGGTDQRGFPRFLDGDLDGVAALDLGAVELEDTSVYVVSVTSPFPGETGRPLLPTITWSPPERGTPVSYQVYLDGVLQATVAGDTFSFTLTSALPQSTLTEVRVDAVFIFATVEGIPSTFTTRGALVVDTVEDVNDGILTGGISLRDALQDAVPGEVIGFDPATFSDLFDDVIILELGPIVFDRDVTLDASGANGVVISAAQRSSVLTVPAGVSVALDSLMLMDGRTSGTGGAIWNEGDLEMRNSTVVRNAAYLSGGAVFNTGALSLENCTLTYNAAFDDGGAILNRGSVSMVHTTIAGNLAFFGDGGGIATEVTEGGGSLALENSIVAGNSAVSNLSGVTPITTGNNLLAGDPRLAPLGDYGGPVWTMPPLPGSPVIEGAVLLGGTPPFDQLGNPRPSGPLPDLGAVEAVAFAGLALADTDLDGIPDVIEPAYAQFTVGTDDSALDSDGDGVSDADEMGDMTNPNDPNDFFRILSFTKAEGFAPTNPLFNLTVKTFPGLSYRLERQQDLAAPFEPLENGSFVADGFSESFEVELMPGRDFIRAVREE